MTVKTYITFKDFLNFHLKNSLTRIILFSGLLIVIFILNFYNNENEAKEVFKSASMWFVIIIIFLVVRSYFSLKKAFYSNKNIQEEISYTFTEENIQTKGETFDGDFTWKTVYRVKENKDWFLIYQSKTTMNMIPKKYFTKNQILELRSLIQKNDVKTKLRND